MVPKIAYDTIISEIITNSIEEHQLTEELVIVIFKRHGLVEYRGYDVSQIINKLKGIEN